ncbi:MAG TPA: efflux transporter periplasmic adaptor subunit [Halieaceae bacterium]|uniref:efflux RND transporter periplasmic adaptor subunit n=1 Tax=Haliea TaxID=475794 RepID=UPI000C6368A3|nr:efflux RND transporter periplasmic adaptor subunit [Haliea sp.]HBQ41615.1 efflux transporter periplasmic adaptor subunit [Halieaceae bacterium]MAD64304.1 efflux transporter periplasmic adaptor subunit [Haliea sp.]MAY93281.1 efflux transporter periplasmic adaptor subunit [Haliea sp.]MBK39934.1 efflux transporter periplasmic adaptor subunit [Haliea sp.]MBP71171.1 efflux transporter periplasmic adaptor subunit [Haliea sp.]
MSRLKLLIGAPAVYSLLLLAACSEPPSTPPPVGVVVDTVRVEPYQAQSVYVGRLVARDDVTIRASVSGYLMERSFNEGEQVQAGDVLYVIDPSEYVAALAIARADLAAAKANQTNAQRNYQRGLELLPKSAISQVEMDNLTAQKLDADARIESAQAQVTAAEVNLGFTTIKAPISGRIGRSQVSPGDLVGPSSGDLTTLVSIDPIEALFQVSEATYIDQISQRVTANPTVDDLKNIEVTLELADGLQYPEVGQIDYFGNRIDAATGTMEARARIPNPYGLLVPGQYVRVTLQDTALKEGLFVPLAAVQADQQGTFALVVADDGTVQRSNAQLGERLDDMVLVTGGLQAGDRVIVRGLQQVRPGMPVIITATVGANADEGN